MAPRGKVAVFPDCRPAALEDAMPPPMLPDTFAPLAAAFVPCFTAPTYRVFLALVAGGAHCVGRHTVTAVALAAGVVDGLDGRSWRHISVFHRCFSRAAWSLDQLGLVVFRLALRWVPPDDALVVLVDDTLARKRGKAIALGSMHHDPLLSTVRKAFASFGHVWVVLALWVPLPFGAHGGAKGVALPVLFRLYVGRQRGNREDARAARAGDGRSGRATSGPRYRRAIASFPPAARRPTKPELAREGIALVAHWAATLTPGRTIYAVGDTTYTCRTTLEGRPPNVEVVGRLRLDAALFGPPPPRRPGQRGRPRTRGDRLPPPRGLAAQRTRAGTWHRLRLVLYGKTVTPLVFRATAHWYGVLREAPIRFVVVRDPSGRRHDEAFFCTDRTVSVAFLLTTYAKRWSLEVAFFDCKQSLGFEDPQNQAARAVRRTAPFAGIVYALVALWGAQEVTAGRTPRWVPRPWYRHKASLSFTDLLAAFRQATACPIGRAAAPLPALPCPPRHLRKSRPCARVSGHVLTRPRQNGATRV
jgi:DDE superfamily endonuclease